MLTLVFFARVREQLDCSGLELQWEPGLDSLQAVEQFLIDERGEHWARVLSEENIIRAVNHTVVGPETSLVDGDEIAFYPPVTGG